MAAPLHLAVALDGAGWHPAAWREAEAQPADLFTPRYWSGLVQRAEKGLLDLVTIEDGLRVQSEDPFAASVRTDSRTDRVRGRLDATLIASRVAPTTSHIGLLPTAVVTHTEPFHLSKAIATLDYVSNGRAGVRVQADVTPAAAAHFGRRTFPQLTLQAVKAGEAGAGRLIAEIFEEAGDYVEVLRRLWDSWEDDAEIRDVATGRFIDRDRVHYIDFEGRFFSVKGPSITPRPPQGQPIVAALAHQDVPFRLVAASTDLGFLTPTDATDAASIVSRVRAFQTEAGRADDLVHLWGDLVVLLDADEATAVARRERLDEVAGSPYTSDAVIFAGTAAGLADLLQEWQTAGLTGFRLRPAALPHDLDQIVDGLVPELQRRGAFRTSYEAKTLRGLLGLDRPVNRYATARTA